MSDLYKNLKTQLEYFYDFEQGTPDKIFLRQPFGDTWETKTFKEAGEEARRMVSALRAMGLEKGDHISIISKNCMHWIIADLALMMGGYVSTPFYANLSAVQLEEVIQKSDTKAAFVGKLDEWDEMSKGIPDNMPLIKFPHYPGNATITRGEAWEEVLAAHEPVAENYIPALSDIWTILFTSGTTGSPKGVVHDYENVALIINSEVIGQTFKIQSTKDPTFFSFLPLNHIAERAAVETMSLICGGSISFAESLETFAKNLQDTQPTLFFAVPRIWTKFYLGVLAKMPQEKLDKLLKIPILSSIVKNKIKKTLGLSRANIVLTGASITPENIKQFFQRLGINLREVYGMTENFGAFTLMPGDRHKPHTVGKPIPFAEGRIEEETGEILMKMPWMMKGYYKEAAKTREVLIDEWLHTGDKGMVDEEGFFKIIGRVKDAFKTSKGKYVVPTTLEDLFSENEYIEQICVAGLGIPQPIAMVNLSEIGMAAPEEAVSQNLAEELAKANSNLHGHEVISTLVVIREPWSTENQLLTPTLKIRRGKLDDKYLPSYLNWHEAEEKVVWV